MFSTNTKYGVQQMNRFNFELPKDLKLSFNLIAIRKNKSMADIVRELISDYVEKNTEQVA